jgi:CheY-like chemotaxis protein
MPGKVSTILAVDDEAAVLSITAMRLRNAGYIVLEATSGEEALRVLESRDDVSVIVSDCNMPGIKGPELARIAQARWPHIGFIATSGHPADHDMPDGATFIQKPYRAAVLISTLEGMSSYLIAA